MTRNTSIQHVALVLMLSVAFLLGCDVSHDDNRSQPEIVAGSSLIADITGALTDATVAAHTLLPSTSCPSQFDLKAGDIRRLQQAQLVLLHPWQLSLANIRRVIEAAHIPETRRIIVDVPGNWMIPETQIAAADALATLLVGHVPEQRDRILARLDERRDQVATIAARARASLHHAGKGPATVLCNGMQTPFVAWAGLDIADSFGRPEDWSVAETERLVRLGRARGVVLVIDNLQSGGIRMSTALARDMGAYHVTLSNFPGGFPDTPTWESAFLANVKRLTTALEALSNP